MGIGKTLQRDISKLILRETGHQTKVSFRNLQLYTGTKSGKEGAMYEVRRLRE